MTVNSVSSSDILFILRFTIAGFLDPMGCSYLHCEQGEGILETDSDRQIPHWQPYTVMERLLPYLNT
jgi:hypothetical protein